MKSVTPYLNFDGTTRDAMSFYSKCMGGTLDIQTFADANMGDAHPGSADRILHARLVSGPVTIMASDPPAGMSVTQGDNIFLSIDCDSADEQDKLFAAMQDGGKVLMPLQKQFWGARFGMLRDKFGIGWMFNYELPKS